MKFRSLSWLSCLLVFSVVCGCSDKKEAAPIVKAPKPVSVLRLKATNPNRANQIAGSVGSWKTEAIGFEVDGRVQFVIEPGKNIRESRYDQDGAGSGGTVLARIDPTRYEIQKASLEAQIRQVKQQRAALQIEIDKVIPAQVRAAKAGRDLAEIEVKRNETLAEQGAGAVRDLDRSKASLDEAEAKLLEIAATKESKAAEAESLTARLAELAEEVKEADRDIASCSLTSPYRGQIAEAHVIPGAYVRRGERVVTVQMMDPIQIEFEASGATRRRLNYLDNVPIQIPRPDGSTDSATALVYLADPVADPETRTFTIQMLVRNSRIAAEVPEELRGQPLATTDRIWWILDDRLPGKRAMFIEENAIHEDAQGPFLFKITNRKFGERADDSRLTVEKVRVELGEASQAFLGIYTFREIVSVDGKREMTPAQDLYVGKVTPPEGVSIGSWSGDTVIFSDRKWRLQPGDLVQVDVQARNLPLGFYVPVSAIVERSGSYAVFAVAEDGESVRRVEIQLHEEFGTKRRIEAPTLTEGVRIVADGAQFMVDGAKVRVIKELRG